MTVLGFFSVAIALSSSLKNTWNASAVCFPTGDIVCCQITFHLRTQVPPVPFRVPINLLYLALFSVKV